MNERKNKTRILVFGMTENPGGVESFLVNYYRHIDRDRIQFDFLCNSHDPIAYEDELIALGGRTFHITARSKNRAEFKAQLEELFQTHATEWDAIWVNVCSLANIDYLKIAKKYGIEKRIIHSHNSQNMDGFLRGVLHHINKGIVDKYATDFWACSEDAAKWFYNDNCLKKVHIIHNAIDIEKYRYDEGKRQRVRDSLGIPDEVYVMGNVGRFHFQKNQQFAIDVFYEYNKRNPNSKLILIGQGEDEQKLKIKCRELGIDDIVLFPGIQDNIDEWLSAFDIFLFPSVFEGLSIVALEAQANGVPVIAAENVIPQDVKLNQNFNFFSLEHTAVEWADAITQISINQKRTDYNDIKEKFIHYGYDIKSESEVMYSHLL